MSSNLDESPPEAVESRNLTTKKRGRKRKSDAPPPILETVTESVSRSGRKRKQINYFDLANPDKIESHSDVVSPKKSKTSITHSVENEDLEYSPGPSRSSHKDRKYTNGGQTTKMMKTLFNLSSVNNEVGLNGTQETAGNLQNKTNIKKESRTDDSDSANVTCAICQTVLEKTLWPHHKQRFHNNLAWRMGEEPLDLNNQQFVLHTLNSLYKKKKSLYCKCGEAKKSVVGFLSHQATCQKTFEEIEAVKVACDLCGKKMLPVSMSTHMKYVHSNKSQKVRQKKTPETPVVLVNEKRGAAKKALVLIKNVASSEDVDNTDYTNNLDFSQDFVRKLLLQELAEKTTIACKFKCENTFQVCEEAISHLNSCPEKLETGFICKLCVHVSENLEAMREHVKASHQTADTEEYEPETDVNEEEFTADVSVNEKSFHLCPGFIHKPGFKRIKTGLFVNAFQWTMEFREKHYQELVFPELISKSQNWRLVPASLAPSYMPKMSRSCSVGALNQKSFTNTLENSEYDLSPLELFESRLEKDGKVTFFCGGPVSAISWLPTPDNETNSHQILAVSVLNEPDDTHICNENYEQPGAIQFWDFGPINNRECALSRKAKIVFSLAHEHGPVWHMEWCASGCFNPEEGRMGLLAVTGSDAAVYIYSIPFPESNNGLYFKSKAVIKLLLQRPGGCLLGGLKYYPSKISWSKTFGHDFVVVGYTNGFLAIFDLNSRTPLLRTTDSECVPVLFPKLCFQAHSHAVTACDLFNLNEGVRWLMSSSLDRGLCLWDLDNHNYPLYTVKKNIVTDGFWMGNWMAQIVAADEGSSIANVVSSFKKASEFSSEIYASGTISGSTICSISGSDWLNGMMHGNMAGEIVAIFPHQLNNLGEIHKTLRKSRMLFGYTILVEKKKPREERSISYSSKKSIVKSLMTKKLAPNLGIKLNSPKDFATSEICSNEPLIYEEADERYGLLFCDNKMESWKDFPESTSIQQLSSNSREFSFPQPNQYPMMAINKIAFNQNRQASLYFATGYQVGLVRVSCMKFLANDSQIG